MNTFRFMSTALLLLPLATACGSVSVQADASVTGDAGTTTDASSTTDSSNPSDAAVPRLLRVFHNVPQAAAGHLYSTDITNGVIPAAVLLSGSPANPTANPAGALVSRDGNTVVYTSDGETEGKNELYMVRFGASGPSAPVKISADHGGTNAQVYYSALAPNGSHAVYGWGTASSLGIVWSSFYFVDLSGATPGAPVALTTATSPSFPTMSPDGSRFAYVATAVPPAVYAVDISGTTPGPSVKVSPTTTSNTTCGAPVFSPNGARLSFVADATTDEVYELWLADTSTASPGVATKVNGALVTNGDVAMGLFGSGFQRFSPDSKKLAYLADATTDGVNEVWVADVSGPTPMTARKANDALVSGGNVAGTDGLSAPYVFSNDSKYLAYVADQQTNDAFEDYIVDVSGSTPGVAQRVNGTLVTGGDVVLPRFAPDSSGLVYVADQRVDEQYELFYVRLTNGTPSAPVPVNGALPASGDIYKFGLDYIIAFSPDGKKVAFTADATQDGYNDVYLSDVSGAAPVTTRVQASTAAGDNLVELQFSNDSRTLLYAGNPTGAYEIWASELGSGTPAAPAKVNSTPGPVSGSIPTFWLAPL